MSAKERTRKVIQRKTKGEITAEKKHEKINFTSRHVNLVFSTLAATTNPFQFARVPKEQVVRPSSMTPSEAPRRKLSLVAL